MKSDIKKLTTLALAGSLAAVVFTGTASADATRGMNPVRNVVQYQTDLDAQQRKLDRMQADLDRRQAALDRRKARWRSELEDSSWRFRMLDSNDDAVVSEAEAQSMPVVDRMFDSLDDNGNNKLSATEFQDIAVHLSGAPMSTQ